jgi:hypothetical protein
MDGSLEAGKVVRLFYNVGKISWQEFRELDAKNFKKWRKRTKRGLINYEDEIESLTEFIRETQEKSDVE